LQDDNERSLDRKLHYPSSLFTYCIFKETDTMKIIKISEQDTIARETSQSLLDFLPHQMQGM
jgi:hypothetical protein